LPSFGLFALGSLKTKLTGNQQKNKLKSHKRKNLKKWHQLKTIENFRGTTSKNEESGKKKSELPKNNITIDVIIQIPCYGEGQRIDVRQAVLRF
jgi:hypothetical protein